jgi:hypothetical protein
MSFSDIYTFDQRFVQKTAITQGNLAESFGW